MPSRDPQLNALVDQQTRTFNTNATEQERIAIFNMIVAKQKEMRGERK